MVMTTETFQEAKEGQMQFQVEFYETEDGRTPTQEFLDSLEPKMNAKMVGLMEILEEKGLFFARTIFCSTGGRDI